MKVGIMAKKRYSPKAFVIGTKADVAVGRYGMFTLFLRNSKGQIRFSRADRMLAAGTRRWLGRANGARPNREQIEAKLRERALRRVQSSLLAECPANLQSKPTIKRI